MTEPEPIRRTIEVRCSPDHAFAVFTERVDLWWPPGHRRDPGSTMFFEPRVGGRFGERMPDGTERRLGEVIEWAPPERLIYSWYPGAETGPTRVEIRFHPTEALTRVEVVHRMGEAALGELWPERAALFERGWGVVLPAFGALADAATAP